jgi:4-carboxymuconolactone decarboxylase
MLSTLAYLMGMQGIDKYKFMLPVALDNGVSPVEAKEVLYQAVDYLGLGRVFPFFKATNDVLAVRGVEMPLPSQSITTMDNRFEKGEETQIRLFGPQMKDFAKKGTINKWLVDNCFGDYYTRKGLSDNDREMVTFCYIAAQGGCEPQLLAHAQANIKLGNDKEFLMKVIEQNVPFIGYPRSLNAVTIVNKANEAVNGKD